MRYLWVTLAAAIAAFALGYWLSPNTTTTVSGKTETVYIKNFAPHSMSNAEIQRDIPSWEEAANKYFAPAWGTEQIKIVLLDKRAKMPLNGGILADFVKNGSVQGALAFHSNDKNRPVIIVYTGVGNFYGYNNSVSFTHELFETLADQNINTWNFHWQSGNPVYYVRNTAYILYPNSFWFNEVCDPVEAFSFNLHGVAISDFITPNWFNNHVSGGFDYMGLAHYPFQVLSGGYAQFVTGSQLTVVQAFKGAGRDSQGFYKGEKLVKS